ncbi:hypothetical protein FNH22_00360 [Fulvivirga sp. M361]|uniref:PD40 domain-containing protein n=1 Tax=Fulvivirga sp. M361 TaxID=2594266 RepID=UPI00117AE403|nr:PD40 domain-containing protein [Fulvivirga sp. M361]TRX62582.1 hypothetical protein FNH22_00360 [Fulvivirga sp. M361]
MKQDYILLVLTLVLTGCHNKHHEINMNDTYFVDKVPGDFPIAFKPELVPKDVLIHRGIFSPDMNEYYYTISDKNFSGFDVKCIKKINDSWSEPRNAFFNTEYNEHGMSFSADGNTLFFSSTRPVKDEAIPSTWHIWKSEKQDGKWTTPEFVDFPNLKEKLVSHPTVTKDGTLYFHASNIDYSDMDIYYSMLVNGRYEEAKKLNIPFYGDLMKCTPYVSPEGNYILFALVKESLELNICYKNGENKWSEPVRLPAQINRKGQGNPYITPDEQFLFYAEEQQGDTGSWSINWVSAKTFIKE